MELKEAYIEMQEASGIEVGDTVRVLRKAEDHEMGWTNAWGFEMDDWVGECGEVTNIDPDEPSNGVEVTVGNDGWYFPFFVLEVVKKAEKEEKIPEPEFKPFDKVFVRDDINGVWELAFYSHYLHEGQYPHRILHGDAFMYCIPFEGNEHLVGSSKNVDD